VSIVAATTSAIRRVIALTATVAALSGCASLKVNTFLERGVDLQHTRTFDFGPADRWSTGDARLDNNTIVADRIRSQVEKQLVARGMEKTANTPEVFVRYHFSLSQQLDLRTEPADASRGEIERQYASVFEAGTLVLDLVEPRTNRLLWRGWAEGSFDGLIDNQSWLEERVDSAVQMILNRLPRL
jgi:hypothetical protein